MTPERIRKYIEDDIARQTDWHNDFLERNPKYKELQWAKDWKPQVMSEEWATCLLEIHDRDIAQHSEEERKLFEESYKLFYKSGNFFV